MKRIIRNLLYRYTEWERLKHGISNWISKKNIKPGDTVRVNWRYRYNFKEYNNFEELKVRSVHYDNDAGHIADVVQKDGTKLGTFNFYWLKKIS